MNNYDVILKQLSKSTFRSRFTLKEADIKYINDKTWKVIAKHAQDFVAKRLAPKQPLNDGKQTPMRGHPVFIAQHATATCCRKCLAKWHHIALNKELTREEQKYIVNLIMAWLKQEIVKNKEKP